jgi:hypothetical protein
MYGAFYFQMNIFETLTRLDSSGRAQLLGRAQTYITNADFLNTLNSIDVNRKETIVRTCSMLRAFEGVPGLRAQVAAWLRS